jgi:hypothetical protein
LEETAVESTTKKALVWGAAGMGAAAVYGLVVRPWHKSWGAEPIDVKRPMPGDDIVKGADEVTNRAINIEAEPEDIWPWLVMEKRFRVPLGAAAELRVVSIDEQHCMVLVAEELPAAQASWSILLTQFAPQRTRLVCRTRLSVDWSPRGILHRVALDPLTFWMFRKWFLEVKERAEQTHRARLAEERTPPHGRPRRGAGQFE